MSFGAEVHDAPLVEPADEAAGHIDTEHADIEVEVVDARPAPPQGIGGVTLSQLWAGLLRYKPVAAAVGAVVVAGIVLPGAAILSDDGFDSAANTRAPLVSASDATALDPSVTDTTAPFGVDAPVPGVSVLVDAAASGSFTFDDGPSAPASSGEGATSSSSPSSAGADAPAVTATTPPAKALAPTYTIREGGWATAGAATPIAGAGVPEGGLPVGKRLGDVDKMSFVRLAGSSSSLVIKVSTATGANRFADQAKIDACRILDGSWQATPAMSFEKAPPIDRNACVAGAVQADGTWRFDLARFDDATDARGFALVPAADAGSDFQLVFQPA